MPRTVTCARKCKESRTRNSPVMFRRLNVPFVKTKLTLHVCRTSLVFVSGEKPLAFVWHPSGVNWIGRDRFFRNSTTCCLDIPGETSPAHAKAFLLNRVFG